MKTNLLAAALLLGIALPGLAVSSGVDQEIAQRRETREAALKRPLGWLSLVGMHWIEPGRHSVGRAADNDIVIAIGPEHLGHVVRQNDSIVLEPIDGVALEVDGGSASRRIMLVPDTRGAPTQVTFDDGSSGFNLIERGGRYALRVRDANAPTRTGFTGLDYYPADPSWRITARYERHPEGQTIPIANVINQLEDTPNPGAVVFERDGKTYRAEALIDDDGSLFLVFADRTSGKETYGAGRMLNAPFPEGNEVVLDFNLAYNPPCAFNDYSTCPLPPPENRLDLAVTAGEKKYQRPH